MKAVLHENILDCYEKVYQQRKMIELSGENVVPDKMPDIGLMGDVNAHVILRVKRTESGLGILEGELQSTACFLPEAENSCYSLDQTLMWRAEFESEEITEACMAIGEIHIVHLETRMLNPRKILLKAQLSVQFTAFEKRKTVICSNAEEQTAIQVCSTEVECSVIGTVCEKTFVASDEYPLPPDLYESNVLCKSVQLRVDDVKSLTNKLIVKGSVLSDVVMFTQQGDAERISFTSGFSFITETDCEYVSTNTEMVLIPNGLYYEVSSDGKILSVEVHGVCQMLAYVKQKMAYISDVYSNFYECKVEKKNQTVYFDIKHNSQREQVTLTVLARSQISRIWFATARVNDWKYTGKSVQISVWVGVCVQYENGLRDWLRKQISADVKIKDTEKVTEVRIADIYCVGNGNEAELRIAFDLELKEERECILSMISSVETDEEHPYCQLLPTLSVVRRGGKLWDLAKEFGSTVDLIKRYNGLEEDEAEENGLLLIPKQMK